MTAITGATIPITIGTTKPKMHNDIVPSNIPLLLSAFKRINETSKYETQFQK